MAASSWELASVTASTVTDLIPTTSTATTVGTLYIANTGTIDATFSVYVTDSSNVTTATLINNEPLLAGDTVKLTNVVLKASRKLRVISSQSTTSFLASGWYD